MVKYFASSAIGALGLAIGGSSSTADASSSYLTSPAALHHLHIHLVQQTLRDVMLAPTQQEQQQEQQQTQPLRHRRVVAVEENTVVEEQRKNFNTQQQQQQQHHHQQLHQQQLHRFAAEDNDDCPGSPFLWKIKKDATGEHVGFAVGTMHLPLDVVTTPSSYASIEAAIEDSCDVYGELNLIDTNITSSLAACNLPHKSASATALEIPNATLRDAIQSKLLEISTLIATQDNDNNNNNNGTSTTSTTALSLSSEDAELAALYAERFMTLPLSEVQRIILYGNTPEYRDKYLHTILSGSGTVSLDAHLLSFGRPANDLEEVSTHCDILKATQPTTDELNQYFDTYSASIEKSLDATLTKEIDMYECGNVDAFVAEVNAGTMTIDGDANDDLLSGRNARMANRMIDILDAETDEKVLFAVGVAHWIAGSKSLEMLLSEGGYSLEHVPEWDREHAENHSNEHCEVMFDPEAMVFVPAPAPTMGGGDGGGRTKEPTHSVVKPTYFDETGEGDDMGNDEFVLTLVTDGPTKMPTVGGVAAKGSDTSLGSMIGVSKLILVGLAVSVIV